jgi:predicted Ser/Thr protein kinase
MLKIERAGRFEVKQFLGRGGHGDVYLAHDPRRGSEVALKLIPLGPGGDAEMLEAEHAGIRIQTRLAQAVPQVAAVYEYGEVDGTFYVAMEYVEGTDLSRALAGGPLSEERAIHIAHQLCSMLEQCHAFAAEVEGREVHGIVHGDIKPENIRLQGDDRVRVLDFGIAKHLSQQRRFTRNLFGTPPYTPPERLERGVVDRASDLWAVGVVLYLMVAGYPPYSGDDEELETRIRCGEPPRPLPAGVSPGLKRILGKALAFASAARYQTAAELKADLEALRDGLPLAGEAAAEAADPQATRRTVPPAEENGATRRTVPPAEDNGATRRTDRGLAAAALAVEPGGPPHAPAPLIAPPPAAESRHGRRGFASLLLLTVIVLLVSQSYVWREAGDIRHQLLTDAQADLQSLSERFRNISWLSLFRPSLSGTRAELHDALVHSAERILDSYHGDAPTTREGDWRRAEAQLSEAVELDWRDGESRARRAYARAHLDRIEAQGLREQGRTREALEKSRDAIRGFREAARRDRDWPDPYLGLARIYAYVDFDFEELQEALKELVDRGYRLGRREQAMLADGHRMRAEELIAGAAAARGEPEEVEQLEQAREHLVQAIDLYDRMRGYADVRRNLTAAERRLAVVDQRLMETAGEEEESFFRWP